MPTIALSEPDWWSTLHAADPHNVKSSAGLWLLEAIVEREQRSTSPIRLGLSSIFGLARGLDGGSRKRKNVQPWDYGCNLRCRMRYEVDHKARTHRRIVRNAACKFRAEGLKGPGVAKLMKASGLTVGGFYKHFSSKDELLVEAIEEGFLEHGEKVLAALEHVPRAGRWKAIVRHYLSPEHCEHPEIGCPIAALAPEIARATPAVRKRIAGLLKARRERVMQFMPGESAAEREKSFNIIFPAMAGAMAVARILPDPVERGKILNALRDHLLASL